jgi:hypothetical protein
MMPVNHKQQIIDKIKADGMLSYFWISQLVVRQKAIDALIRTGAIVSHKDDGRSRFPWMVYTVVDNGNEAGQSNPPIVENRGIMII